MPSSALQSRIAAFETITGPGIPSHQLNLASPSSSPPNPGRKSSLIDLRDWIVADAPSGSSGSQALAGSGGPTALCSERGAQLISSQVHLNMLPKPLMEIALSRPPPLPPRNPSLNSLSSTSSTTSASIVSDNTTETHLIDSFGVGCTHTYPPVYTDNSVSLKNVPKHAPTSSVSSFQSVSLSSDTDSSSPGSLSRFITTLPLERDTYPGICNNVETDATSLTESFEELSVHSLSKSPTEPTISCDWKQVISGHGITPPKLPRRLLPTTPSSSASCHKFSDKPVHSLSFMSYADCQRSSTSSPCSNEIVPTPNKSRRPTPVPPVARTRFVAVFNANMLQQRKAKEQKEKEKSTSFHLIESRKARHTTGWRGLSVDLITEDLRAVSPRSRTEEDESMASSKERLDGQFVKAIWRMSKLNREKLRNIWNECDPCKTGSLDKDEFVKGMWRVDEELRRAHHHVLKGYQGRLAGPPITPKPK